MTETVVLGIGATSRATVDDCLRAIASVVHDDWTLVALATISGKEDVVGRVADVLALPWTAFSAEDLERVDVPHPSGFVHEATGSASVAEAAAVLGSGTGKLVLEKVRHGAVTVAAAVAEVPVPQRR